jgi:GNAT superfamily N-acetyltransferase
MPDEAVLLDSIDSSWLEEQASRNPILHAYAQWDLIHYPDRAHFVTLSRGGHPLGYLLIWMPPIGFPAAHWISQCPDDELLLTALPPRPLTVVVPERVAKAALAARGPATARPLELMEHHGDAMLLQPTSIAVRRLSRADYREVNALLENGPKDFAESFRHMDLDSQMVWGAFEGPKLTSVANASVTLPTAWILNNVFTGEPFRGKGYCKAVVTTATRAALEAGASIGLYVYSDNIPAHRAYEKVGFRTIEQRQMIDATGPASP